MDKMFAQQELTDKISRAAACPPIDLHEVLATWLMLFHFQLGKVFSTTFGVFGCFQPLELLLSQTVFVTIAHVDPICMKVHLPRSQLLRPCNGTPLTGPIGHPCISTTTHYG